MTITFIGHGYVGLVSAAIFADLGNTVWVVGHTPEKISNLNQGILPIYEPGLEEIVKKNLAANRIRFTLAYDEAIADSDVIFIAVGTPSKETGEADLSTVFSVAEQIGKHLAGYSVVVTKSTVPIGTYKKVKEIIENAKPPRVEFDIASAPEFLREGQAINDTLHPDRVVIGTDSEKAQAVLVELHRPISAPNVLTTIETAEMIKYASNAFLATKISFANAIAQLSEKSGANGLAVLEAVGLDKRIGHSFLSPGAGYGGSCFPKDVKALIAIAKDYDYDFTLLHAVEHINSQAIEGVIQKVRKLLQGKVADKTIGVLGLAFKPDTDDMRAAPAIEVIKSLHESGAKIKAYDPIAMENAKKLVPQITFAKDSYDAVKDADVVVLLTEWNEFKELDMEKVKNLMKQSFFVDGRNVYDPSKMKELGFTYVGVGR